MTFFDLNPPVPDLLHLDDSDVHLLYRGQSNLIYAAPNTGKAQVVAMLIAQETRAGNGVLLLDFEKSSWWKSRDNPAVVHARSARL